MSDDAECDDGVIVAVGENTWFAPSVLELLSEGFPVAEYLDRHAKGDPGEAATLATEIMAHAVFIAEDGFPVFSAYKVEERGIVLCFLTEETRKTTYILSVIL